MDGRVEGSSLVAHEHSCRNLVFGGAATTPDHDAVLRIGSESSEAAGPILHNGMKAMVFTDPRHLEPSSAILIVVRIEPKPSSYWRPIFNSSCSLRRGAWRHPPGPRPPAPAATTRSVACGPVPQSWSCGLWANAPFAADTIAPERCPSGTAGTATPIGSCHGAHGRCPIVPSLSRGSCHRSGQVRLSALRSG